MEAAGWGTTYTKFTFSEFRVCVRAIFAFGAGYKLGERYELGELETSPGASRRPRGLAALYGDSMITPAISVISAVEGLGIATPVLNRFVLPLTIIVLLALFLLQKGRHRVRSFRRRSSDRTDRGSRDPLRRPRLIRDHLS